MSDYEETPYIGYPVAAAHPWRIAWTSFVHGGPRPAMERARILEIGCGDGAHLLSVAAFEPGWTAHGLDGSARAVAGATAVAATCGLENVTFERVDIAEARVAPGAWDFVIAHGVYSWIDAERRAALRRLVRAALAPAGLAYLSFNALPAWGLRGRVRDLLRRHPQLPPVEMARLLLPHASEDIWGRLVTHELNRLVEARPDYLAHEYLEEDNEAFWLGEVLRDAAADGLAWVGDTQFDTDEGRWIENARRALGVPGLAGEELADLLGYRQLRAVVLAREDAPRAAAPDDDALLDASYVAGRVTATSDDLALWQPGTLIMRALNGQELEVPDRLARAALLELASIYPDALATAELLTRAHATLVARQLTPEPDEPRRVREGLLRLWRAGALELRRHKPRLGVPATATPRVSAFTRLEARVWPALSTPLGTAIGMTPDHQTIVRALDGTPTQPTVPPDLLDTLTRWGLLQQPP